MLRKTKPSARYGLDLPFKFGRALGVPRRVIERQKIPRCAARMQRQCSARLLAVFATRTGSIASVQIAGGFDSRRLHFCNSSDNNELPKIEKALSAPGQRPSGAAFLCAAPNDVASQALPPAVARLAKLWPDLPPHIKEAINSLIDAALSHDAREAGA
jgi:hypothetical protein